MARFVLPQSNPENEHFVLHYNAYREAFSAHNIVEQQYFNFIAVAYLAVAFLILTTCIAAHLNPLLFVVPFIGLMLVPAGLDLMSPTHLEITREGLRFLWSNPLWYHMGTVIEWKNIIRAEFGTDSTNNSQSRFFVLTIDTTDDPKHSKLSLMLLPMIKSSTATTFTLRLLEKGFFQSTDRAQFIQSLQKHVPAENISSELLGLIEFGAVPTYTALWLDEFGQRRRGDSLLVPEGAVLADGQYQVFDRLGAGGQSTIYGAQKLSPEETSDVPFQCVLKEFVLPSRGGFEINRRAIENVQREYTILKSLDSPDIVKALDLFVENNRAYLVLERISGTNLRTLRLLNDFNVDNVLPLATQMCDLLAYLHGRVPSIIHRDFTPDNLILTADKRLKLIDFNIALSLESNNTKTVAGKHAYISPEQFRGKPTVQSDIYALGATLYFLLTGTDPEPITKSVPKCDAGLAAVVGKCTEPVESERYENVEYVKQALLNCRYSN